MMEDKTEFDIDLVYLWVDGLDPAWREKRSRTLGIPLDDSSANCKGRYANNDELKYSLRAAEKNIPWIRRIFIVTDNQVPEWLDVSHPKIQIVDHSEILPESVLPTFNSVVIEHRLYKIPGLAEHFLYSNDDNFINRPLSPSDFFNKDGYPVIRVLKRPFRKLSLWFSYRLLGKKIDNYKKTIDNAARLVEKKYGRYVSDKGHHNVDAFCRSQYERVAEQIFKDEIEAMLPNRVRCDSDIQRVIYSYVPIVEKKCKKINASKKTSIRADIHRPELFREVETLNPLFFCVNDSEYASDEDRIRVKQWLQDRYPEKSSFEK